jgi:hypothetical protein
MHEGHDPGHRNFAQRMIHEHTCGRHKRIKAAQSRLWPCSLAAMARIPS